MASLKDKTIHGFFWSFIDNFAGQGINFIVGIILARLLTPKEFGLIGMITVFIAISGSFVNSGFSQALIRKKDCSETDYSTVFYFNLFVGLFFFGVRFIAAPLISRFFNEPQLTELVRVIGSVIVIESLTIIQRTTLTKRVDFKLQTKISVISSIFSGSIGITMAVAGFGVWSLVAKTVSQQSMNSFLLWLLNRWRPFFVFSLESFKNLFSFGYKLLLSGLIDTIYRNIYYLIIGKYFSAVELGFYTRATQFNELPSQNINGIISRVSYPVLAQMQDNKEQLKAGYKKLIKGTMLITFVLMILMAATSESMIITLIGEKWRNSVIYLQLLCFVGMMYPLHSLNLNMLNVSGRSDLFLKLEVIKKILAIPTIIIGVFFGIKIMIAGMIINSLIAYYLNSYWSGKFINYPMKEQIGDILPAFFIAVITGILVFITGNIIPFGYLVKFIVQILVGLILVLWLCEFFKVDAYLLIKEILQSKIKTFKNVRK